MQFLRTLRRRKHLIVVCQIAILVAFFAIWELAVHLNWLEAFIFSSPSRMWRMLLNMLATGELLHHIWTTSWEVVVAFILGTIIGVAVSVALWWNGFLRKVLNPYLVVFNSLPKTALAPIIIVWLGNNVRAIIVTALLISVVVTILNVLTGFMHVDEEKIKLARSFGAKKRQVLAKVVFPASVPDLINALKVNIGLTFVGVIVGEFLVAGAGLGHLIVYGSQIFRMDMVMLSIIILCLLAAVFYQLIVFIEKRFARWAE
ncbi:MAG: ABC transporter permease [Defluviitaleaceae bacterium]|nr:ABC transporter permease [Defluviitaleaceae bacterium]